MVVMKKKILLIGLPLVVIIAVVIALFLFEEEVNSEIIVTPVKGDFRVTVKTTGELKAKNSIEIEGPSGARSVGISQMKISRLIDEGTVVKEGDFVAELDRSEISRKITEIEISIQKYQSQYKQSELDSTLNLSAARDELENLKFALEEKKLLMEQSKYEPPAVIRQAEINYERAQRNLLQAEKNYKTKVKKAITDLSIVNADLQKEKQKLAKFMDIFNQFTIYAPSPGMLIYAKEWSGRRKTEGTTISAWDPVVAELPDLTQMESLTYINEVDIQKIKKGQQVTIGLDAQPDKSLKGKVTRVANIGEQRRSSDSKVFEVIIDVIDKDTTLRPSMTTGNEILIDELQNVVYIPLDCLHPQNDTTFVYKKDNGGYIKQEVAVGLMNDNEVVIENGLNEKDEIYLSVPEDDGKMPVTPLKKKSE